MLSLYGDEFPNAARDEYGEKLVEIKSHDGRALGYAPATARIRVYHRPSASLVAEYRAFSRYCDQDDIPHESAVASVEAGVALEDNPAEFFVSYIGV